MVYHTLIHHQAQVSFYTASLKNLVNSLKSSVRTLSTIGGKRNFMPDRYASISTDLSPSMISKIAHLRSVSNFWDNALRVPGTKMRIGLDSVMGVFPLGGDALGIILSCYILFYAVQFQIPTTVLIRMVANIALDGAIGVVPILGDLFDTTWKANSRNVNLLEAHIQDRTLSRKTNFLILIILWGIVITIAIVLAVVGALLFNLIFLVKIG